MPQLPEITSVPPGEKSLPPSRAERMRGKFKVSCWVEVDCTSEVFDEVMDRIPAPRELYVSRHGFSGVFPLIDVPRLLEVLGESGVQMREEPSWKRHYTGPPSE